MHQRLALRIRPDRDAQMLIDALCIEMADDDLALAQLAGDLGCVVLRMAGENEIGRLG